MQGTSPKRSRSAATRRSSSSRSGGADRERDRGAQHRRVRRGLQDRLVLAGELAVLLGEQPGAAARLRPARGRRARRRGCASAPGRAPRGCRPSCACRTASTGKAGVFGRSEEKLGGAGKLGLLGQRAGAEERLVGVALFGLDHQRGRLAGVLARGRVGAAPEVVLERLVGARSVGRDDDQGVGLPVRPRARARRRRGRPPRRSSHCSSRVEARSQGDRAAEPVEGPLLGGRQRLQLGARDRPRPADASQLLDPAARPVERAQGARAALGLGQGDGDVDLGHVGAELAQPRFVAFQVAAPPLGVGVLGVEQVGELARRSGRPDRRAGPARARSRRRRGGRSARAGAAAPTSPRSAGRGRRPSRRGRAPPPPRRARSGRCAARSAAGRRSWPHLQQLALAQRQPRARSRPLRGVGRRRDRRRLASPSRARRQPTEKKTTRRAADAATAQARRALVGRDPQLAAELMRPAGRRAAPGRASAAAAPVAARARRGRSDRRGARPASPGSRASRSPPGARPAAAASRAGRAASRRRSTSPPARRARRRRRSTRPPALAAGDARRAPAIVKATAAEPEPRASDGEQRRGRVGEPAQRDAAGHRQRPALDLVDPPLGAEDPLVGADRLASRRSRQHPLPDRPRRVGDLIGAEDEPADQDRRDEEHREVGELPVQQEDQADDRDDPAVDLRRRSDAARRRCSGRRRCRRRGRRAPAAERRREDEDRCARNACRRLTRAPPRLARRTSGLARTGRAGRRAGRPPRWPQSRTRAVTTTVRRGPSPSPSCLTLATAAELEATPRRRDHRRRGEEIGEIAGAARREVDRQEPPDELGDLPGVRAGEGPRRLDGLPDSRRPGDERRHPLGRHLARVLRGRSGRRGRGCGRRRARRRP